MTIDHVGDVVVIAISGASLTRDDVPALQGAVEEQLRGKYRKFVLDVLEVRHIDSGGTAALINAYATVTRAQGQFSLCSQRTRVCFPSGNDIYSMFGWKPTREKAIASLGE